MKKGNDTLKDLLIDKIANILSESRNMQANQKLNDLRKELESQGSSEDKKAFAILRQIQEKIDDAHGYIVDGNTGFAINCISEAIGLAAERRKLCTGTGDLTKRDEKKLRQAEKLMNKYGEEKKTSKPKTRVEELRLEREEAIKERDKHRAERERLLKVLAGLPVVDRDIEDEMFEAQRRESEAQARLDDINNEIRIEENARSMHEENRRFAENQSRRTFSQDQMDMLQQDNAAMNAAKEEDLRRNLELQQNRNANADRHREMQDQLREASRGQRSASYAQGNPYAQANPYGGGANSNSPLGSKADINKMISILTQSQEQYNEKLEDASDELRDFDAALRSLLQKRQGANASECLVLDGQIDQLNAKRGKVSHTIKRLRNAIAQLDEQLTLMGKVEFQQDLESMKSRIQQLTGGRYADIEGLSMYLKDAIKAENQALEDLGVGNAVVDSEEITMNSYSGASAAFADATNVKDEDKYAALEAELGLATR